MINFVRIADPEIVGQMATARPSSAKRYKTVLIGLFVAALLTGGLVSWFASSNPDGLEWSMAKVSGKEELDAPGHGIHAFLASLEKSPSFPAITSKRIPQSGKLLWKTRQLRRRTSGPRCPA